MDGNRCSALVALPDPAPTMLASGVTRMRWPGCLRELTWLYVLPEEADLARLAGALEELHRGRLVRASERWGDHLVVRLILQFEVEFRLGERPRTISLHHRVSSPLALRSRHHAHFEALLERLSNASSESAASP